LLPLQPLSAVPTPKGESGFQPWPRGTKVSPKTLSDDPLAGMFPGAASPSPCGSEEEYQQRTQPPSTRQTEPVLRFRGPNRVFAIGGGGPERERYDPWPCTLLC